MNLTRLLAFLPLIVALFFAYHLVFKQQLPTKSLGAILTYFLGIIIIFAATFWLVTTFLAGWATSLLQEGNTAEWQLFINASESVVEDALGVETQPPPVVQPTVVQLSPIVVTATPRPGDDPVVGVRPEGQITYTVVPGDTLFDIANRFGTTINDIMRANNLTSHIIYPGQVLIIPAP